MYFLISLIQKNSVTSYFHLTFLSLSAGFIPTLLEQPVGHAGVPSPRRRPTPKMSRITDASRHIQQSSFLEVNEYYLTGRIANLQK